MLLGYGEMGHAMQYLLKPRCDIKIWDPYYAGDLPKLDLEKEVSSADHIIFCTPTAAVYELAEQIGAFTKNNCLCLSMAKALDKEGRTAAQALENGLGRQTPYGVLYGPMIAEEILADRPAFSTLATSNIDILPKALALFQPTSLKLKPHEDMHGAAWCAVLKNVYAMLFGMADELKLGDNMRGFLAVAILQEMAIIMDAKGGSRHTPYTLAGLGDLITTGTSEDSHHHELGRLVVRGERSALSGEGINTLDIITTRKLLDIEDYPLLRTVWKIMRNGGDARRNIDQYTSAPSM